MVGGDDSQQFIFIVYPNTWDTKKEL
jgi:hypothetical protein